MRFWPGFGGLGSPRAAAFFSLCYLYVWLRVQPHLIFHVQEPVFFRGGSFLHDLLQVPGGLAAYAAAFAGQSYTIGWLGALVIVSVAAAIGLCARDYVRGVTGRRLDIVAWTPMVLLLVLHNRYQYDLAFDLSLLIVLASAAALTHVASEGFRRTALFLLLTPFVYWIAGGGWLLFALLAGIHEAVHRRPVAALSRIAVGAALPWMAMMTVYPGTYADAYLHQLPVSGLYLLGDPRVGIAAALLYLFTPIVALVVAGTQLEVERLRTWPSRVAGLGLALLSAVLIHGSFDVNHRTMLEIDHLSRQRDWEGVLGRAPQLTAYDVLTVYNIQRALCFTGRLASELFSHPHLESGPIFLPSPEAPPRFLVLGDNLLDLGYVNKAEHMLQEALEILGDRPSILRRLVLVNVLKGRPAAARVYLGLLARSPLDRQWAEAYAAALDVDPQRADDAEVSRLRQVMVKTDYPGFFSTEDVLRQLLERNPSNLLAFDLLMGHYLQTARPDKIVQNIRRLEAFPQVYPGTALPRLYEEALMLWATQVRLQTGSMPALPLRGRQLSLETQQRYAKFSQLLATYKGDSAGARRELAKEHRDTFWYYYLYRGAEAGVPITSRATQSVQ
jgi:hypothetical protein